MITFKTWLERIELDQNTTEKILELTKTIIDTHIMTHLSESCNKCFHIPQLLQCPKCNTPHPLTKKKQTTIQNEKITITTHLEAQPKDAPHKKGSAYGYINGNQIHLFFKINNKTLEEEPQTILESIERKLIKILSHEITHLLQHKLPDRNEYSGPKHYFHIDKDREEEEFTRRWHKSGGELEAELQGFKTGFQSLPKEEQTELLEKGLKHTLEVEGYHTLLKMRNKNYLLKTLNKMGIPFKSWEPIPEFNE